MGFLYLLWFLFNLKKCNLDTVSCQPSLEKLIRGSSHGIVFLKAMKGEGINISAFRVAAFCRAPLPSKARLITAAFVRDLKRTICIKNIIFGTSLNSSKWVSMGPVLQCDRLKGLWPSPAGQGSEAEEGYQVRSCWHACQRGCPGSCNHSGPCSSGQEGQEVSNFSTTGA